MLEKEFETNLAKALRYCSTSEKCEADVRDKLIDWGVVDNNVIRQIVDYLKQNNFINHERYVEAYINDAIRLKRYGKIKIRYQLLQKHIDENLIDRHLSAIDNELYLQTIRHELQKRVKTKISDEIQRQKVVRSMLIRGFEPDLVRQVLREGYTH